MNTQTFVDLVAGAPVAKPAFTVSISDGFTPELETWARMADHGAALPFQSRAWLEAWAATKGREAGVEMLGVTVRDLDNAPVMGLPLVRQTGRLTRIAFADGGLADYNAPILSAYTPRDATGARQMWRTLLKALPKSDQVQFQRMPLRVGRLVNPLSLVPGTHAVQTRAVALDMTGSYEDWFRGKPRRYRMELGRCARLFDATPGARFERAQGDGTATFRALEVLQRDRIAVLGHKYALDDTPDKTFYRMISHDLATGPGLLTSLVVGDEVIAALFGLRQGNWFIMLRIGAAASFSRLSPARLLITRTMEKLRADGVTSFDFGLGDYRYKRKLGGEEVALCDLTAARTPLGLAVAVRSGIKRHLRASPLPDVARRAVSALVPDRSKS